MAEVTSGSTDALITALKGALDLYEREHPGADAKLYRQNSASVRIRVVDRGFEGKSKSRRHDQVWSFLSQHLGDDAVQEISLLLLLTPGELKASFMNFEFEHPLPSSF